MSTLVIDTALPLTCGSARQRASAALLRLMQSREAASHLTVDLWHSEWRYRRLMLAGNHLQPAIGRGVSADGTPAALPEGGGPSLRRRIARLLQHVREDGIRRVVLADPLLAPLATALSGSGAVVQFLDDGLAEWAALATLRAAGTGLPPVPGSVTTALPRPDSRWHECLPRRLLPDLPADEAFFVKGDHLLALATGMPWADRAALQSLSDTLARLEATGAPIPPVAAIGFEAEAMARFLPKASCNGWAHLTALAGSARALWLPWMPPACARLAEAALRVGTPVVADPVDARHWRLDARVGVVCLSADPAQATMLVAGLFDPALADGRTYRAIAAPVAGLAHERAETLAETMGLPAPSPLTKAPEARARFSALWAPVEAIHSRGARLLRIRVPLIGASRTREVRLRHGGDGHEMGRFFPGANLRRLPRFVLEEGIVLQAEELATGLVVDIHGPEGTIESVTIPAAAILPAEAEITACNRRGTMVEGSFWLDAAIDPNEVEITTAAGCLGRVTDHTPPLSGLDLRGVRFETPHEPAAGAPQIILQRIGAHGGLRPLRQRRLMAQPSVLRPVDDPTTATPALERFRDLHHGRRGWIIGNGPSVRLDDLARIPREDVVFCFNRFYLAYGDCPLREDYLVSADTLMIRDFGQEMIDRSAGLPFFCIPPAQTVALRGEYQLLVPSETNLSLFSADPNVFVSVGGSSVFVAMQLAWFMGLRDLLLYGIDYSFSMQTRDDPRYPFPVATNDDNHFIPAYRAAKPWVPPNWRDIAASFLSARIVAETGGGRVRNATRGGRLETFERVDADIVLAREPERAAG